MSTLLVKQLAVVLGAILLISQSRYFCITGIMQPVLTSPCVLWWKKQD
jgi:hypothetical protein